MDALGGVAGAVEFVQRFGQRRIVRAAQMGAAAVGEGQHVHGLALFVQQHGGGEFRFQNAAELIGDALGGLRQGIRLNAGFLIAGHAVHDFLGSLRGQAADRTL